MKANERSHCTSKKVSSVLAFSTSEGHGSAYNNFLQSTVFLQCQIIWNACLLRCNQGQIKGRITAAHVILRL